MLSEHIKIIITGVFSMQYSYQLLNPKILIISIFGTCRFIDLYAFYVQCFLHLQEP